MIQRFPKFRNRTDGAKGPPLGRRRFVRGLPNKKEPLRKAVHGNTALIAFLCRTAIDSASQSLVTVRQIFSDGPAETMG